MLTAPVKGDDVPTVVAGVNQDRIVAEESIYSAASCTTNAIVPVLRVMNDAFGIQVRFMSDQLLPCGVHISSRLTYFNSLDT